MGFIGSSDLSSRGNLHPYKIPNGATNSDYLSNLSATHQSLDQDSPLSFGRSH
jgi:hypothetical protein